MRRTFAAALLFVTAMGATTARAADQDFTLSNETGYTINQVFVSGAGTTSWGQDILGSGSLGNGRAVEISFEGGGRGCNYDLMVIYDDGEKAVWSSLNLCTISNVHIHWNKSSGVTSATTE